MILAVCPNPSIDTYAWLDDFEAGNTNRIKRQQEYPGGKGTHVALALNEMGANTGLLAAWAGHAGNWIKDACTGYGLKTLGPHLSQGANRKCYTFLSKNPNLQHTELLEPGPVMDPADYQQLKKNFETHVSKADLAVISGSWPKESPATATGDLVALAKGSGTKVILDCAGVQLEKALESGFFGLHLNEHEAMEFCGTGDVTEAIRQLHEKVDLIALTKGKEGLYLSYLGKLVHANVRVDKVISTVGCGDCLTAGVAFGVSTGMSVLDIARHGVAFGAANCLREDLGMLYKTDVEDLLPKVITKELTYA